MSVGLFLLLIVCATAAVAGVIFALERSSESNGALNRAQKNELASLRRLVKEINADAHRYQELEPNFTSTVIDKVSNHYQKELES